jgi:hypothetical protein
MPDAPALSSDPAAPRQRRFPAPPRTGSAGSIERARSRAFWATTRWRSGRPAGAQVETPPRRRQQSPKPHLGGPLASALDEQRASSPTDSSLPLSLEAKAMAASRKTPAGRPMRASVEGRLRRPLASEAIAANRTLRRPDEPRVLSPEGANEVCEDRDVEDLVVSRSRWLRSIRR